MTILEVGFPVSLARRLVRMLEGGGGLENVLVVHPENGNGREYEDEGA
jgi:hypothetical protein